MASVSPTKSRRAELLDDIESPWVCLVDGFWGKGLPWAFENELFMVIDPVGKKCRKSEDPNQDAKVLKERLFGVESGDGGVSDSGDVFVLSEISGWQFPCQRRRILLRECYFEAYRAMTAAIRTEQEDSEFENERGNVGVLLTGNPGTGKSVFLSFCLIVHLLLGMPTAFQPASGVTTERVYLLCGEGCFLIDSYLSTTPLDKDETILALCDNEPTEILMGPDCRRAWPILYASSPNPQKYDHFKKTCMPYTFYMDIWSGEDLQILNSVFNVWGGFFTPEIIADLFDRFRPSPRFLNFMRKSRLTPAKYLQGYEREVITKAKPILQGATETLRDENFWLDTTQTIAVLRPVDEDDQDTFVNLSPVFRKTIPTTYIYKLIASAAASTNQEKTKHFFRMVRGCSETAGLAGTCFEGYVKTRLSACEDELVHCEPLCSTNRGPSAPTSFSFALGKGVISFTDADDLARILLELPPKEIKRKLFSPVQRNFPTMDFLFFKRIRRSDNTGFCLEANFLQVTVSPTHSVKAIGMVIAANAIPLALQDFVNHPPRLITLVPDISEFRKTPQDVEYPARTSKEAATVKAAATWLKNVPQFIATCPNWATAWGRTRSEAEQARTETLTAEFYAEKWARLEAENNSLKRDVERLEQENAALKQEGVGSEEPVFKLEGGVKKREIAEVVPAPGLGPEKKGKKAKKGEKPVPKKDL